MLRFLPLDCVGEVFSCMMCCIPQIGAGARVDDCNVVAAPSPAMIDANAHSAKASLSAAASYLMEGGTV